VKTPDEISGTDEQQAEYAARALRTIRADALSDSHMGRLVSLAGHPPRKLAGTWPAYLPNGDGRRVIVLAWDALTETVVMPDAEITIHPKP
jgi:hypothetical protein